MSLRLRLGLWYGGLTGLVVLLMSVFTYAVHSRAHYDELDRALVGATEHLAAEYVAMPQGSMLPQMLSLPIAPDMAVRVYGPGGHVLTQAPNAAPAPAVDAQAILAHPSSPAVDPLVGLAPAIIAVHPGGGAFGLLTDRTGVRWRVYVLPIGRTGRSLAVVVSLAQIDASIAGFRQLVGLFALTGALLTLLAGWLLASRALRPVATLTEAARTIARSRGFSRRVLVGRRRDELGQLATTFNEMLASLEHAYQAEQRFVADASHELRAPLTAIQANLELLERQPAMAAADRQEAVEEASREARRLAALVADLLALARADAGVTLRRQRVELDRVALDALSEARHLARGQQLEVAALEPAVVTGDPDRLKQLVLILLDNALKYTPATGCVTLSLHHVGAGVMLTVRDTGIGISADDLPHVFERFYRADPARTRDTGGTGLGLPIAQWIAAQHGGAVTLTSAVGQGTTATVALPVRAPDSTDSPGHAHAPGKPGRTASPSGQAATIGTDE